MIFYILNVTMNRVRKFIRLNLQDQRMAIERNVIKLNKNLFRKTVVKYISYTS